MTRAVTVFLAWSVADTLMPIRLGDIERGTVAVSRPERSVVLSATNGDVGSWGALDRPAREADQRVRDGTGFGGR